MQYTSTRPSSKIAYKNILLPAAGGKIYKIYKISRALSASRKKVDYTRRKMSPLGHLPKC